MSATNVFAARAQRIQRKYSLLMVAGAGAFPILFLLATLPLIGLVSVASADTLEEVVVTASRLYDPTYSYCSGMWGPAPNEAYAMCIAMQVELPASTYFPEPPLNGAPNPPPPGNCSTKANRANRSTIQSNEAYSSVGYLPRQNPGSPRSFVASDGKTYSLYSGVTVGYGVDLRFWTNNNLISWGVSQALINWLGASGVLARGPGSYGIPGSYAWGYLNSPAAPGGTAAPVTWLASDVTAMSNGAMSTRLSDTATLYYKLTGNDFEYLPENTQTALLDLVYSGNLPHGDTLQTDLAAGNFQQLANDASANSNPRVKSDGNAIQADIASGALPTTGPCGTP